MSQSLLDRTKIIPYRGKSLHRGRDKHGTFESLQEGKCKWGEKHKRTVVTDKSDDDGGATPHQAKKM